LASWSQRTVYELINRNQTASVSILLQQARRKGAGTPPIRYKDSNICIGEGTIGYLNTGLEI
jgi:hypothetical protein